VRITDVLPEGCGGEVESVFVVGDRLFFKARRKAPAGDGEELWVSDGTAAGTHIVEDVYPGPQGSHPRDFVDLGGVLLFTAIDGETGRAAPPKAPSA
jgi:ELWxxDGT repeat protein